MRRLLSLVIVVICAVFLCSILACVFTNKSEVVNIWDCTVICAKESSDNSYVITYSDEKIVSTTGILTLENKNDFGIVVYLCVDGNERVEIMNANSRMILYELVKEAEYTVGCHASVTAGTEIKLLIYDGEGKISEYVPLLKQPIHAQEAIEIAQNFLGEVSKKGITNFDNPKAVGIVFEENMSIAILSESRDKLKTKMLIGREIYRITFNTEQDGLLGPIVIYVDKYNGDLLGMDSRY